MACEQGSASHGFVMVTGVVGCTVGVPRVSCSSCVCLRLSRTGWGEAGWRNRPVLCCFSPFFPLVMSPELTDFCSCLFFFFKAAEVGCFVSEGWD